MSLAEPDQLSNTKTLYQVSAWEIIWRNFLAGVSRGLGGLLVYFLVMIILVNVFLAYIWPSLEPTFQMFSESTDVLRQLQTVPRTR